MSNIATSNEWPAGVYQYADGDVLDGGADSAEVLPIKQLANRSLYQRLANVTPWDSALATEYGYPSKAVVMHGGLSWRAVVANAVEPGTDPAKWERWGFSLSESLAFHGRKKIIANESFTVPEWVTTLFVSGCGGGGGGGSATSSASIHAAGGGGGSGFWTMKQGFTVLPGSTLTAVIGGGGLGAVAPATGVNGTVGAAGGTTSISELGLTLMGGAGGGGAVVFGAAWGSGLAGPGPGGNGGQPGQIGTSRQTDLSNMTPGGNGGSTPFGEGGVTTTWTWGLAGLPGSGYGAGGAGGQSGNGGGGAGTPGVLILEW